MRHPPAATPSFGKQVSLHRALQGEGRSLANRDPSMQRTLVNPGHGYPSVPGIPKRSYLQGDRLDCLHNPCQKLMRAFCFNFESICKQTEPRWIPKTSEVRPPRQWKLVHHREGRPGFPRGTLGAQRSDIQAKSIPGVTVGVR